MVVDRAVVMQSCWHKDMSICGFGSGQTSTADFLEPFPVPRRWCRARLCPPAAEPVPHPSFNFPCNYSQPRADASRIHCGEESKSNEPTRASGSYL